MPDSSDKNIVASYYQKKIYSTNYKIGQIVKTRKHYDAWMECSNTDPNVTFIEYLDNLKASYQEELAYWKKKMSEV